MKKVLIAGLLLALGGVSMASAEDEMTSLSYISYLERYATVQPANQEESLEAVINMPLVGGDRVDTAREARMEIILADGNTVWLDEYTTLSLDAVAFSRDSGSDRSVMYLAEGSIILEITEFDLSDKPIRIDGRAATVYLDARGLYRVRALPNGGLRVEVMDGLAEAVTSSGGVLIRAQSSAEVGAGAVQRSENQVFWSDDFAAWVDMRRQIPGGESSQYVDLRYSRQAAQLDNYGSWIYVDSINSWAWQPTVGVDWAPYRAGRWYWTPTGWSWLSYEPWGWLPYHYGSWHFSVGFGWVWAWGGYWSPAWVNWVWWPGYVGWCPYGYYNNWYWNYYGGYYPGHSPPHRPPYPGGGGGSAVPRRDVIPPRRADKRVTGLTGESPRASQAAVDINGRVRMASVDRRGWTAVRQEDFASPNLTRLASAGRRVMPAEGDQMGVVMTGPLATRSPSRAKPSTELERVFRGVETRNPTDVSALMARDNSANPDTVRRLARPTTVADIGRRSVEAAAVSRKADSLRRSLAAGSPLETSTASRLAQPNRYRPTMYGESGQKSSGSASAPGTSSGSRQLVQPQTRSRSAGSARPVIVPGSRSSVYSRPTTSTSRTSPTGRSTTRAPSSVGSSSGRSSSPRSSSVSGSRSAGSRSTAGTSRSSGGSSRSSASGSRSSSGGSRSSAGSSRPSGGSSTKSSGARRR